MDCRPPRLRVRIYKDFARLPPPPPGDLLAQGRALGGPIRMSRAKTVSRVSSPDMADGRDGSDGHKQPRLQTCWHRTLPLSTDSYPPARAPRPISLPTDSREPLPSPQIPFRGSSGRRRQTLQDWISYSPIVFQRGEMERRTS